MTALKEALSRAGMASHEYTFQAAVQAFIKAGGTYQRAHDLIDAVRKVMPERDQIVNVGGADHTDRVNLRQPYRGGRDQSRNSRNAQSEFVPPVREPSLAQRSAMSFVAKSLARTVLDTYKTSDGRAWGDVGAHELDGMGRDGALAIALKKRIGVLTNAQRFKSLRELVSVDMFNDARREAMANG